MGVAPPSRSAAWPSLGQGQVAVPEADTRSPRCHRQSLVPAKLPVSTLRGKVRWPPVSPRSRPGWFLCRPLAGSEAGSSGPGRGLRGLQRPVPTLTVHLVSTGREATGAQACIQADCTGGRGSIQQTSQRVTRYRGRRTLVGISEERGELVLQGQPPPSGAFWKGKKPATEASRNVQSEGEARQCWGAPIYNRGSCSKAVGWGILSSRPRQGPCLVHSTQREASWARALRVHRARAGSQLPALYHGVDTCAMTT